MMHPYPFFGFPNFRRPYYYPRPLLHKNVENCTASEEKPCFPNVSTKKEQEKCTYSSHSTNDTTCSINNSKNIIDDSEQCFEIFGLKLHFDDLLIIALLFFLYQEDVKDTYLYIALILLLLS